MNSNDIIATLFYADIFDYPLTKEELYKFLINSGESNLDKGGIINEIIKNDARLGTDNKYIFLKGRDEIVAKRQKRERWSKEKIKIAAVAAGWLKLIPWVRLVGVTGGLALLNSDSEDDIDILIVSKRNRLWLTRLASVLLLEALGRRRRPDDREVCNKICLNMFLDEDHLAVSPRERDLFSAHEVCQLKILWDKEGIGEKFLWENRWIKKFLPNSIFLKQKNNIKISKSSNFFEQLAKKIQLWYMRKRRTTEVISDGVIRFHPRDARRWILNDYDKKLKQFDLENQG